MSDQQSTHTKVASVDTNTMPWETLRIEEINHDLPVKTLVADPDTGMSVLKIVYEAGHQPLAHA